MKHEQTLELEANGLTFHAFEEGRDGDFSAGLEVIHIAESGHFVRQEKPNELDAHLIGWLESNTPMPSLGSSRVTRVDHLRIGHS